eukprot:TRINITY_DN4326_c0_g2_i1.p1 TRINITY_DN4326_c0_g2~~TRINITY_DN4326_c0_g2_i1.p1  ORF type:complete len:172 (-),score=1.22 TRINITY_DN4326_c0_g2_i1:298-813(-)
MAVVTLPRIFRPLRAATEVTSLPGSVFLFKPHRFNPYRSRKVTCFIYSVRGVKFVRRAQRLLPGPPDEDLLIKFRVKTGHQKQMPPRIWCRKCCGAVTLLSHGVLITGLSFQFVEIKLKLTLSCRIPTYLSTVAPPLAVSGQLAINFWSSSGLHPFHGRYKRGCLLCSFCK